MAGILPQLLDRFSVPRGKALEFGVEYGYSTAALSRLFQHVTGVDTFLGDPTSTERPDYYQIAKSNLQSYPNVTIIQEDYKKWITHDRNRYDLIHIDIWHAYEPTMECGTWAAQHSDFVIFHDTESYPIGVKDAVEKIAVEQEMKFYNYSLDFGMGVIVR
jgi:predicted O-methyltransferase YrrM